MSTLSKSKYGKATKVHEAVFYETKDYGIFRVICGNRLISMAGEIRKEMYKDLAQNGWKPYCPAITFPYQGGLGVIDAQHRIEMAKELGIPVFFRVIEGISLEEAENMMIELQRGKPWQFVDYVNMYSSNGKESYIYLQKFAKENNISISKASSMLYGQLPSSGNVSEYIKNGTYKIKNINYANSVMDVFNLFKSFEEVRNHSNLLTACAKLVFVKEFDKKRLEKKLNANPHMVNNAHTNGDFLKLIEEIYNRKSSDKVNLSFLAQRECVRRLNNYCK